MFVKVKGMIRPFRIVFKRISFDKNNLDVMMMMMDVIAPFVTIDSLSSRHLMIILKSF